MPFITYSNGKETKSNETETKSSEKDKKWQNGTKSDETKQKVMKWNKK